jgi:hypothetical protein
MGIHIPEKLLRHSDKVKLHVRIKSFSDRQLKNIVKQVLTGSMSSGDSATTVLARHIAKTYKVNYIQLGSWRTHFNELPVNHPLHEAVVQACALAKLEIKDPEWYMSSINSTITQAEQAPVSGYYSLYWLPKSGMKIVRDAAKLEVSADHPVQAYLTKLLNREIEKIEMEVS